MIGDSASIIVALLLYQIRNDTSSRVNQRHYIIRLLKISVSKCNLEFYRLEKIVVTEYSFDKVKIIEISFYFNTTFASNTMLQLISWTSIARRPRDARSLGRTGMTTWKKHFCGRIKSHETKNSNISGERSPFEGSCCSGQGGAESTESEIEEIPKYRVVLLGDSGVGKTALVSQFMTSEYMNTYDASLGNCINCYIHCTNRGCKYHSYNSLCFSFTDDEFGEKTVSILLDEEESEMIFIDHPHIEMSVENSLSTYEPHACIVVYSIVSRTSFQMAEEILNYLWREHYTQERSVIVVGNKSDLARSRTILSNEGKQLATSRECKFIETSSGIKHNVDELLVGVLKQIRLRESREKKLRRQCSKGKMSKLHASKTAHSLNLAREILNKMCLKDSK
ncbi:GTP-binding protein REM 2-like isoform X2, partial [Vespula squamosa]